MKFFLKKAIYHRSETIQLLRKKRKTTIFQMSFKEIMINQQFLRNLIKEFNNSGVFEFCKSILKYDEQGKNKKAKINSILVNRNKFIPFDHNLIQLDKSLAVHKNKNLSIKIYN